MDLTVGVLLSTFILSVLALFVFIASMAKGLFGSGGAAAVQIFDDDEIGRVEDPAATQAQRGSLQQAMNPSAGRTQPNAAEVVARLRADQSSSLVVGVCLTLAVVWLVLASVAGLISSIKLHAPDWWVDQAWITFGRIRPIHLNLVAYGWCSMAGIGVALWLIPRLLKTELVGARYALLGGALWTVGVVAGTVALALGHSDGLEWLEYPWQIDALLVGGRCPGGFPDVAHAVAPARGASVCVGLVHRRGAAVVSGAVPGGQLAGAALRRPAGLHELVVRPQRPRPVVRAAGAGRVVLLHSQGAGQADPFV